MLRQALGTEGGIEGQNSLGYREKLTRGLGRRKDDSSGILANAGEEKRDYGQAKGKELRN